MVFDTEMRNFRRNACIVVGGNITHAPDVNTYSDVVTRDSICISLIMAVLHDLEVKAADVLNMLGIASYREKFGQC